MSISPIARGLGVQVVARVPSDGPVPPPMIVVMPAATAWSTICGQMKWTWPSIPPAVRIRPSPATMSVVGPISSAGSMPSAMSGLPALPSATMRPSLMPTSQRTMPQWSSTTTFVMTMSGAPCADVRVPCSIDSRIVLPPPKTASSPPMQRSSSTSSQRSVSASRS